MRMKHLALWTAFLMWAASLAAAPTPAALADAAEELDRAAIRALLDKGADVNAPQVDGMTALHWATYRDDSETVRLLLEAGANATAENRYGVTPLSLACTNGNAEVVELFLDAGVDANTSLPGGETALMTAARTGTVEVVKALLSRGADVHAKEARRGQTALMWAAAEGHTEVVEELIKAGADVDARIASGFTPLLFAAREGRPGVVRMLLDAGADVNDTIRPPKGVLSQARGYLGAPRFGATPLLLAAANAHFELAADLLEAGADPNAGVPGYTVLHAIARVRKPGVGDNNPPPDGSGNMDSIEFVKKIVEHGADLNARMTKKVNLGNTRLNKLGATPLFLAAQSADAELMRLLAALGADPLLTNKDNSTPLMAAAGLGTRSPGEDAGTELEVLEAVQVALDLGIDIDAVDSNGDTAMHGAAYKNLPKVVELLAEKGADIEVWNRKNKYGWTPLSIADGYRFGNFKPSPVTIDAIVKVMASEGVLPPENREAVTQQIY